MHALFEKPRFVLVLPFRSQGHGLVVVLVVEYPFDRGLPPTGCGQLSAQTEFGEGWGLLYAR
jgi:hypothetical protein